MVVGRRTQWLKIVATGLFATVVAAGCGSSETPASQSSQSTDKGISTTSIGPATSGEPTTSDSPSSSSGGEGTDVAAAIAQLYEEAKAEGSVTWTASKPIEQIQPALDAFAARYPGIKVNYINKKSGDQLTQIRLEQAAKRVTIDIAEPSGFTIEAGMAVMQPTDWAKYGVPAHRILGEKALGLWSAPGVWAYDTSKVAAEDVPHSWDDLLKPRWNGKIGMDSRGSVLRVAMAFPELGGDAAVAFAEKVQAQSPHYVDNNTLSLALLTSGQVEIATATMNNVIADKAKGAPIELAPISPVSRNTAHYAVVDMAPHPSSARLLLTYLVSTEGSSFLEKGDNSYIPPSTDCSPAALANKTVSILCEHNIEWADPETVEQYVEWGKVAEKIQTITRGG